MIYSAGLAIVLNEEEPSILLVHPTNSSWKNTLGIPKGIVEDGEDILEAALRETKEEIGFETNLIESLSQPYSLQYYNKQGIAYKTIYYYIVFISHPQKKFTVQFEEVDWAGFVKIKELKDKIFLKQLPIITEINKLINQT